MGCVRVELVKAGSFIASSLDAEEIRWRPGTVCAAPAVILGAG